MSRKIKLQSSPQPSQNNGNQPHIPITDEWHRLDAAYREIQRRDGTAEQHAWRWERTALVMVGLVLVLSGIIVWQLLTARRVQALVQVVQMTDTGQLVQVGIPQDILSYTPPEGLWMDMLASWVQRVRWRGVDTVLAKHEWAWAFRHTCGQARKFLQHEEEKEKPFELGKRQVMVEVKSVTKTLTPASYQVLWAETSIAKDQPTKQVTQWTGTFTVGQYRPLTMADTLDNRLGLCITAFDYSKQPSKE